MFWFVPGLLCHHPTPRAKTGKRTFSPFECNALAITVATHLTGRAIAQVCRGKVVNSARGKAQAALVSLKYCDLRGKVSFREELREEVMMESPVTDLCRTKKVQDVISRKVEKRAKPWIKQKKQKFERRLDIFSLCCKTTRDNVIRRVADRSLLQRHV